MQITGLGGDSDVLVYKTTFYNFSFVLDTDYVVFVDITVSNWAYSLDRMSVRMYKMSDVVGEYAWTGDKRIDEARVFIESGDFNTAAETVALMIKDENNGR